MAMILGAGSCQSAEAPLPALPPGPPVVVVSMREYRYDYAPAVPAGRVVFRFVNAGRREHQPDLLPLGDDFPPIDEQVRGQQRRVVTPFAGLLPRRPGQTGTFAVDLEPGRRYAFVCFAEADDGQSHSLKGMTSEFRTAPASPGPTTPR